MTTIEINKLCAEFLDAALTDTNKDSEYYFRVSPSPQYAAQYWRLSQMEFHSDSSWQDVVMDKIHSLDYSSIIGYNAEQKFYWASIFIGKEFQRKEIKSVEGAIGESKNKVLLKLFEKFIVWHNQRKLHDVVS